MNKVSRVTGGVIRHFLHDRCLAEFGPLCVDAQDGLVLALLGPTQSGKSLALQSITKDVKASIKDPRPGSIPVASLQIETVSDGRAKPKWLSTELLKVLEHPIYKHIGTFEELEHYMPSRGRDETTLRVALKEAFTRRFTRKTILDEVHLLTRTKNPELRASIMESIKSACAMDRSLILCGAYEAAYKGILDSPHFAGRLIVYDFGRYTEGDAQDVKAWIRVLKSYSGHLNTSDRDLLSRNWLFLLRATHGVVGLLDKMLWQANVTAKSMNCAITQKILESCAAPKKAWDQIRIDIERGAEALEKFSLAGTERPRHRERTAEEKGREARPKPKAKPFVSKPDRHRVMEFKDEH